MNDRITGDNRPDYVPTITESLPLDYAHLPAAVSDYEVQFASLPDVITTKEEHDKAADFIATMRSTAKGAEGARVSEKDPYLRAERAVDGFFNPVMTRIAQLTTGVNAKITGYLKRKADEERERQREIAREEERKAEVARRAAREAERKAEEAKRQATVEKHTQQAEMFHREADMAENQAAALEQVIAEKPGRELGGRERSDRGTLTSLKREWVHVIEDIDQVPLDSLRAYIPRDTIDRAIKSYVRNGGRNLNGVRIFEEEKAQTR